MGKSESGSDWGGGVLERLGGTQDENALVDVFLEDSFSFSEALGCSDGVRFCMAHWLGTWDLWEQIP